MNCLLIFYIVCALIVGFAAADSPVPSSPICEQSYCPTVSRIGMGALHLGDRISGLSNVTKINQWIQHSVSLGITLFDLADVYPVKGGDSGDSATLFGQALAMTPGLREKITIVAKMGIIFPTAIDTSLDHLSQTLDWYLKVLQTSAVDILVIHYSNANMDANAVAQFFVDVKAAGKAKHFGVSNHYPSKFNLLQTKLDTISKGDIKLVTHEFEISAWNPSYFNYNSPLVDHAYEKGIKPLAWSSLGGDPLGGLNRLFVKEGERQVKIRHALKTVGKAIGCSCEATTALAWLLSHPSGVIPLIGTTNLDRITQYATAFQYVPKMTNDLWYTIADAGGVCAFGDSQCNYDEYK